jgi:hypothetical protein
VIGFKLEIEALGTAERKNSNVTSVASNVVMSNHIMLTRSEVDWANMIARAPGGTTVGTRAGGAESLARNLRRNLTIAFRGLGLRFGSNGGRQQAVTPGRNSRCGCEAHEVLQYNSVILAAEYMR